MKKAKKTSQITRKCFKCQNSETYSNSQGYSKWYDWNGKICCQKCWGKLDYEYNLEIRREKNRIKNKRFRERHPKKIKLANQKRIKFHGNQIKIQKNPRIGICVSCKRSVKRGEIQRTHMHHIKYDPENPDQNTIELCVRCHTKEHAMLRRK